jgi:hypothetical protein
VWRCAKEKIGCRHRTVLGRSVGVLGESGEKLLLWFRRKRVMGLREGNVANVRCWGINPLILEREWRTHCWFARSLSIIGGKCRPIYDSLAVGGVERVRRNCG